MYCQNNPIVRILSYLDPLLGICKNVDMDQFSLRRTVLFLSYDIPVLFTMMSSVYYSFYCLDFAVEKKSPFPNSITYQLWLSFVFSFTILLFVIHFLCITTKPHSAFRGVYMFLSF